ncbi:MAG: hypothetical protein K2P80_05055, partial [Beijerinckiaceae bacterium]|nr:hypothetical protein [Beijerinckiaceae bacterium]
RRSGVNFVSRLTFDGDAPAALRALLDDLDTIIADYEATKSPAMSRAAHRPSNDAMPDLPAQPCVADFMLAGYTTLSIHCASCRCIRELGWKQLGRLDMRWTLTELVAHLRYARCQYAT